MLQLARPPLQLWSGPMHRRPLLLHAALGAGVQTPVGRGKGEGGRRKKRGERRREGGAGGEAPCCRNVILHQPGRFWANLRPNRAGIDALDSPEGVEHGKHQTKFIWAVFDPPQSSPTHPSPPVGLPGWAGPGGGWPVLACRHSYNHRATHCPGCLSSRGCHRYRGHVHWVRHVEMAGVSKRSIPAAGTVSLVVRLCHTAGAWHALAAPMAAMNSSLQSHQGRREADWRPGLMGARQRVGVAVQGGWAGRCESTPTQVFSCMSCWPQW